MIGHADRVGQAKARWHWGLLKLLALAYMCASTLASAAENGVAAERETPVVLRGRLAAGKDATHSIDMQRGGQARFLIVKGGRSIVVDVYDPQKLAADEGVTEGDWFPVERGQYMVIVSNVTGLGAKQPGKSVVYEIRVEAR